MTARRVIAITLSLLGGAIGFTALGFWISQRRRQVVVLNSNARPALNAFDADAEEAVDSGDDSYVITASPEKILARSPSEGNRYLLIGTDQPIRIGTSKNISASRGVYIASGTPREYGPFPPSAEVWAVRASANNASVGVMTGIRTPRGN